MRVAFVTRKVVRHDGQGRVNLVIIAELLARGYEVLVVASEVDPELGRHPRLHHAVVGTTHWPTQLLRDQTFALAATRVLLRERKRCDLVVVNGFVCWVPADINIVHFVHASWLRSPTHPLRTGFSPRSLYQTVYTLLNIAFERWGFVRSGVLIAVSQTVRDELLSIGMPPERVRVIENGVDLDEFHPGPADRSALGGMGDHPIALFVGDARTGRKNLDGVLRALVGVPGLTLAVVGAADRGPFPAMAERLGIANRVRFLGHRHDIADLMRGADLFVFPTRYEPFGLVILEAAASSLPVITTRLAGAAQLLEGGAGVVLDDPEDTPTLTAAMLRLADDETLRRRIGKAARTIAESHGWATTAAQYADLIESTNLGIGQDDRSP
jgi:glycosyltransferase involved in cell wall biosynthesis